MIASLFGPPAKPWAMASRLFAAVSMPLALPVRQMGSLIALFWFVRKEKRVGREADRLARKAWRVSEADFDNPLEGQFFGLL